MPHSEDSSNPAAGSESELAFDVFLSHNSQDKPRVRQLADALLEYEVRPWLDERELVPGRPWQNALEEIITTTRTAAVLVGPDGLGPWEEPEMRACLSEFVERKLPVIPVLLPGAAKELKLPLFLRAFTWVDLREGLTVEGIERLVWGIKGKKLHRSAPRKLSTGEAASIAAKLRQVYGERIGQAWDERWASPGAADNDPRQLAPFIDSQGIRLLTETDEPRPYLRAEYFRAGRVARSGGDMLAQRPDAWVQVDRSEVANNSLQAADGAACDLSRLVITTDAGIGKTTTMEWLEVQLNRGDGERLAVLLTFRDLRNPPGDGGVDGILAILSRKLMQASRDYTETQVRQALEFLRAQGRLVLLLDGLDQAPAQGSQATALRNLIDDVAWQPCRIIVSGRPHAIQRHWDDLFADSNRHGWRFVQVDEFDEPQQRQYLGRTASGKERFDLLPLEDREILATPRVLAYLRKVPDDQWSEIRTQADVYWRAIDHLLHEGLSGSREARRIGLASGEEPGEAVEKRSLDRARHVLAAIAFAMTLPPSHDDQEPADAGDSFQQPNFDGVPDNEFPEFLDRVYGLLDRRPGEGDRSRLERDFQGLSALNAILEHGFFDTGAVGLEGVFWRNRSLQEFFTAYWLAQFCDDQDARRFGQRLVCSDRPQTESCYWVWRFLCEMPEAARNPRAWSRAIEPIFRPGDGTIAGTCRSGELIYRAWPGLEELVHRGQPLARRIQAAFWGEFENEILSGRRGDEARRVAQQFCDHFQDIPTGRFQMGSPPEKQGMPAELKRRWQAHLAREGDPAELAEEHLSQFSYAPGKAGQRMREERLEMWTRVFRDRDVEALSQQFYPANETPRQPMQEIEAFQLNRWPTVNAWYRLFDPGHGLADSWYRETYRRISPEPETPAIYVSWYDAWAFCLWARWDGLSCQLPHENEWEYAAKAGTDWSWNRWWGDGFDASKCNAEQNVGRTTPPDPDRANPWGLEDMLGNVWEWTDDEYRRVYDLDASPDSSARVLRGGSWGNVTSLVRSAFRCLVEAWDSGDFLRFSRGQGSTAKILIAHSLSVP